MLIDMGCDDDENVAWDVDNKVLTEIDDDDKIPERSMLDMTLLGGSIPSARHEHLLAYIWETYIGKMPFNPIPNSIDIEVNSNLERSREF